jgi:hypothetical protein
VFSCLSLARNAASREEKQDAEDMPVVKPRKIFGFVHEIITVLSPQYAELSLRLFLHAATVRVCKFVIPLDIRLPMR